MALRGDWCRTSKGEDINSSDFKVPDSLCYAEISENAFLPSFLDTTRTPLAPIQLFRGAKSARYSAMRSTSLARSASGPELVVRKGTEESDLAWQAPYAKAKASCQLNSTRLNWEDGFHSSRSRPPLSLCLSLRVAKLSRPNSV